MIDIVKDDETLDDLQIDDIRIIQKKEAFRFGVDAVLLANYAKIKRGALVADLCSGTGIVPFIISGKTAAASIIGIEIQDNMVEMAKRSVKYNKLEHKVNFINGDIKNIDLLKSMPKADVVTVNPPYKLRNSGLINSKDNNAIARHEILCTLDDVIRASNILLKDNGRFFMVHRPDRLADIMCTMRKYKLEPKRIQMVQPSISKAPNIILVEGQKYGGTFLKWEKTLYVHNEDGSYTEEINKIYGRNE
ncbi:MAG: SAM-dependent methyltransferase [Clostridiaceae bacterium]|jgi:tRNA1(Val) A37 N6-methylase TrmN6|nr:SAM-dependent methyltransferase [Clostridiaceae bacterium]